MNLKNPHTRVALFDELVKIANTESTAPEEKSKGSLGTALRAMGVGAAGGAIGYGLAELAGRNMKFLQQPNTDGLRAAKIILPILSGSAVMMADRYRQKMNEEYSKVKGFRDRDKKQP